MRRYVIALFLLASCHASAPTGVLADGQRYVNDPAYRRQVLVDSLVNPNNSYSQLRLTNDTETGWGALPEWNPAVVPATGASIPTAAMAALDIDSVPWDVDALVALGGEAFTRYPAQLEDSLRTGLAAPATYGLWSTPQQTGGVVWVQLNNLPSMTAMTCSSCHASLSASGSLVLGKPNAQFNLGAMVGADWGPGRIDVTSDGIDNPTAIPDLRPVRSEQFLQHDADVNNGVIELATRIETLIITSNETAVRPPRKLVFAMALYLWQLEPIAIRGADASSARGAEVFASTCAPCHAPPDYSGGRVPLATVGTDPSVGDSPDRTTGTYRVPSLRGVGDRGILFAAGEMSSLDVLLDPTRTITGHQYGLELTAEQRTDLIAFLQTLQ